MAEVNIKVKDIVTIHTDTGNRLDQPMIEVTLECNVVGKAEKHEIKFSEMLSNLVNLTDAQLIARCQAMVESYAKTAYKGQQALEPVTKEWTKTDQLLGREFTINI